MPKEDNSAGLLSKVVKFVRNPGTSWADLDSKEADRSETLSKQLLKDMIERKRRNDFVRKREFDMLRKMRKREAMVGQDVSARPSFFHSSMPSKPDDRANTLKKIDEIEAQMSMQWWKTKQGNSSSDSVSPASYSSRRPPLAGDRLSSALTANAVPAGYAITEPAPLQAAPAVMSGRKGLTPEPPKSQASRSPLEVTPFPILPPMPVLAAAAPQAAGVGGLTGVGMHDGTLPRAAIAPRMMAANIAEQVHDAELDEVAIRFANGDDTGAETGLLNMLAANDARAAHPETWMALFDFYRCTAQQEKFETAAIQFVERFDRSGPQWFSMPQIAKQLVSAEAKALGDGPAPDWICPSSVGAQTIVTLKAALAKASMPWRLDWSNLKTIDIVAVEPLCKIFSNWSVHAVQLRFIGTAQLQRVLQNATPSGVQETAQQWWKLRLEVLRVIHRPDEFELAAIDFCVTYEVSPPAWESARCDYKPLDPDGGVVGGHTSRDEVSLNSAHSNRSSLEGVDTQIEGMSPQLANLVSAELSGQIRGHAVAMLNKFETQFASAESIDISCAKLIRVDFSAAGTLLNWASTRQAENCSVQFTEVNRLVAAFFNVIGITAHALVTTRVD